MKYFCKCGRELDFENKAEYEDCNAVVICNCGRKYGGVYSAETGKQKGAMLLTDIEEKENDR
jgi:hypothetical protein